MVNGGSGGKVKVCYIEGDLKRFISGTVKDEDDTFLVLDLDNYELKIAISSIIKIEAEKPRRTNFDY